MRVRRRGGQTTRASVAARFITWKDSVAAVGFVIAVLLCLGAAFGQSVVRVGFYENPPKLFDRKTDPNQKRDVLKKNPAVARRLHRKLIAEMKRLDAPADWIAELDAKPKLAGL